MSRKIQLVYLSERICAHMKIVVMKSPKILVPLFKRIFGIPKSVSKK